MAAHHRSLASIGWGFPAVLLMALGCREKTPSVPAAASASPSPTPAISQPAGAISPPVVLSAPVDAQDDPAAPSCLPKSEHAGRWSKREPVRVFGPSDLARLMPAEEAARLGHFRIKAAARCAYQFVHSDGRPRVASIVLIETDSADDSCGLLTCRSSSTETFRVGGETRVERGAGLTLHAWQGRSYICLHSDDADPEATEESLRLLLSITGTIRREDAPTLLDAFPRQAGIGRRWLVRHPASLPPGALDLPSPWDPAKVAEWLALRPSKDALLCVAAFEVPQGRRPDVVWVARYPSTKRAREASARYAKALVGASTSPLASTNLLPPRGAYLVGTWTAEEEAMLYMLPRVYRLLPQ